MKYGTRITLIIVSLFLFSQLIGLFVVNHYLSEDLPYNIERPDIEPETSFLPIILMILFITAIAILLMKFKATRLWKVWFFLGISIALLISFNAFIPSVVALILALIIAAVKVFKPNFIIHNMGELFIYGGLAALFVPILSILSMSILLVLISIYDAIAVWKTKHMVKIAKYQAKMRVFAGLLLPYRTDKISKGKGKRKKSVIRTAILGGGDIGFPLLFAGVILRDMDLLSSLVVVLSTTIALFLLLYSAQKNKFYPAMPFLSAGCFAGYFISLLL